MFGSLNISEQPTEHVFFSKHSYQHPLLEKRRGQQGKKESSLLMWKFIFSFGFIIILLSTKPQHFKAVCVCVHKCVCVSCRSVAEQQRHSRLTGGTVHAAAAAAAGASWRKATAKDAKHPKHTLVTQSSFSFALLCVLYSGLTSCSPGEA